MILLLTTLKDVQGSITIFKTKKLEQTVRCLEHVQTMPEYPKSDEQGYAYCLSIEGAFEGSLLRTNARKTNLASLGVG